MSEGQFTWECVFGILPEVQIPQVRIQGIFTKDILFHHNC